jgi:hypothetical protein
LEVEHPDKVMLVVLDLTVAQLQLQAVVAVALALLELPQMFQVSLEMAVLVLQVL